MEKITFQDARSPKKLSVFLGGVVDELADINSLIAPLRAKGEAKAKTKGIAKPKK